ncbi:MAG TPA: hypothetical protein DF774_07875 [Rheinheimera sp.]|uniref:hypothetical protein n=1 Tax=Rheinheimera sp. TaxID=1869214 RepID=UPI000EBEEFE6|nr:hypothetical protein [Rheinheimera sp.]HCU65660.1 hypothetical protein [Rheinheimera sp.]
MSDIEPQPWLVIRNQLLAFALLTLLGSCVHLPGQQPSERQKVVLKHDVSTAAVTHSMLNPANSGRDYNSR